MADHKNSQEAGFATELDDQQLDEIAGGTTRAGSTDLSAPVTSYKPKYADSIAGDIAQVGLGVAAN